MGQPNKPGADYNDFHFLGSFSRLKRARGKI